MPRIIKDYEKSPERNDEEKVGCERTIPIAVDEKGNNRTSNNSSGKKFEDSDTDIVIEKLKAIQALEKKTVTELIKKNYSSKNCVPRIRANNKCNICVVAPVSAGKSTLLNAICEYPILPTAQTTASAVPTYIQRARNIEEEYIAVYPLKLDNRVILGVNGSVESSRYVKGVGRVFKAKDIDKSKFNKLLDYLFFLIKGNGTEEEGAKPVIDNLVYFMKNKDYADTLLGGDVKQRLNMPNSAFDLTWEKPRHRFVLLMILLCLYIKQNNSDNQHTPFAVKANKLRNTLLKEFGIDPSGDYGVCLDWYSESIPEGATLIDLPGTGSDTQDSESGNMSSHSRLVKGILEEADAIWVLGSEKGVPDTDLKDVLKDEFEMQKKKNSQSKKNTVCIFNYNRSQNAVSPDAVEEFIKNFPFLTGEKCYVVDALAGEYKFLENGIDIELTQAAVHERIQWNEISLKKLECAYKGDNNHKRGFYHTFSTSTTKDKKNIITVKQNSDDSYSFETFVEKVLTEYVARLRSEVELKEAIDQLRFFQEVKSELMDNLRFLMGNGDLSDEVKRGVNETLDLCEKEAKNKLARIIQENHGNLAQKLEFLSGQIGKELAESFRAEFNKLKDEIRSAWRELTDEKSSFCLQKSVFNYIFKGENLKKINRMKDRVNGYVSINAFEESVNSTNKKISEYREKLDGYVFNLKRCIYNFIEEYKTSFSTEYDKQRDRICASSNIFNHDLKQKFDSSKEGLLKLIEDKMNELYSDQCKFIDALVEENGDFEQIISDTDSAFIRSFSENVLSGLRRDINERYSSIIQPGWLVNPKISIEELKRIISDDFSSTIKECEKNLEIIIDGLYGNNFDLSGERGFPIKVIDLVQDFNNTLLSGEIGAMKQIRAKNSIIKELLKKRFSDITDLSKYIEELKEYIRIWNRIGEGFYSIDDIFSNNNQIGNDHKLYALYRQLLKS